jgi:glycosyltransferase involved in cell wall biosynthesis
VCPRKNQLWGAYVFSQFASTINKHKSNGVKVKVRLQIVGAARENHPSSAAEQDYLRKLQAFVASSSCNCSCNCVIEVLDSTDDVVPFYRQAHCLLLTSLNEMAPTVIAEALACSLPVLSTNVGGIGEMVTHGKEGFLFAPFDTAAALECMQRIYNMHCNEPALMAAMCTAAMQRYEQQFSLTGMVHRYRQLLYEIAPPTVLVDMDGTLVDWDSGFYKLWGEERGDINRTKSYDMELCVEEGRFNEAYRLIRQPGLFLGLPEMPGAVQV